MNTQHKHSINVKNKQHTYFLIPKKRGVTHIICESAGIDQDFLNEDVPALLLDLPNLIISEQEYKKAQSAIVQFRLKPEEKKRLEQEAVKNGFANISAYLRKILYEKIC